MPELVKVIVCGALCVDTVCAAKLRDVVERPTTGSSAVPLSVTVWGLLLA